MTSSQSPLCSVGIGYEKSKTDTGAFETDGEGFGCSNNPVGKFEIGVSGGGTMEFWLCKKHRNVEQNAGNIVQEVTTNG